MIELKCKYLDLRLRRAERGVVMLFMGVRDDADDDVAGVRLPIDDTPPLPPPPLLLLLLPLLADDVTDDVSDV